MNDCLVDSYSNSIIFFDGDCNFCNKSVQFIIKRDYKGHFRFASLQSTIAENLLAHYQHTSRLDSIVLMENGQLFTESTAVLHICRKLDGLWKVLYIFILFPKPIRNAFYRWFAKNRYRFFGKQSSCIIPTPEIRKRFLNIDQQNGDKENE
ncbi:thiol-disulfide oxidoreductase DCC family protein [Lysinibacillus telephonicus]|uniref:Thiol-disulfide oxidoreductase DCC family protein n=1 Tax=Lysinibacillus telephonicus TaxID=1714840 RepID=A0A431ULV9_9BACI|nr:thiol-disulfide oxidoreductase DCC family protein [Lysinibacillus telephonicus]RTQ90838.1 thiol-disulfide oxidoreductase DCC family protein [Lysinibacillus telephonicus]